MNGVCVCVCETRKGRLRPGTRGRGQRLHRLFPDMTGDSDSQGDPTLALEEVNKIAASLPGAPQSHDLFLPGPFIPSLGPVSLRGVFPADLMEWPTEIVTVVTVDTQESQCRALF